MQSGVFCLNLIDQSLCRAADFCGVKSGRDVDKFKLRCACTRARLTASPRPALDEAPAFLCCRVKQRIPLGSHELFLCAVEDVYVKDALFDPDGSLHLGARESGQHAHGEYFAETAPRGASSAIPSRGRCAAADLGAPKPAAKRAPGQRKR